ECVWNRPAAAAHTRAARLRRRQSLHYPTIVIIDAEEVSSGANDGEIVGLHRRWRDAEVVEDAVGILAAIERVEEPAIVKTIGPLHSPQCLEPLVARKDREEVERRADARGGGVGPNARDGQAVRQQQMMPGVHRGLRVSAYAGCVLTSNIA